MERGSCSPCGGQETEDKGNAGEGGVRTQGHSPTDLFPLPEPRRPDIPQKICVQGTTPLIKKEGKKIHLLDQSPMVYLRSLETPSHTQGSVF